VILLTGRSAYRGPVGLARAGQQSTPARPWCPLAGRANSRHSPAPGRGSKRKVGGDPERGQHGLGAELSRSSRYGSSEVYETDEGDHGEEYEVE
jgi:hypothetical protein